MPVVLSVFWCHCLGFLSGPAENIDTVKKLASLTKWFIDLGEFA